MKTLRKFVVSILAILLIAAFVAFGVPLAKFAIETSKGDYKNPDINAPGITIVYRPTCSDCRRILPKLYFEETWKNIGHHVPMRIYNANKLSTAALEQLEVEHTPSMIINGKTYSVTSVEMGEKLWEKNSFSYDLK